MTPVFTLSKADRHLGGIMYWCRRNVRGYGNWAYPEDRQPTTWKTRRGAEAKLQEMLSGPWGELLYHGVSICEISEPTMK